MHDATVIVCWRGAGIAVVIVSWVDWRCDTVASALCARTARCVVRQPRPSAVFGCSAEGLLDRAVVVGACRASVAEFVERRIIAGIIELLGNQIRKFFVNEGLGSDNENRGHN